MSFAGEAHAYKPQSSDPITPADLDAAFTAPVTAWLADPTAENKAAVMAAAQSLLDSDRDMNDDLIDAPQSWEISPELTIAAIAATDFVSGEPLDVP